MPWLHGTLYATILEAKDLPMDTNTGLNLKVPGSKTGLGSKLMKGLKSVDQAVGETSTAEHLQCCSIWCHYPIAPLQRAQRTSGMRCPQDHGTWWWATIEIDPLTVALPSSLVLFRCATAKVTRLAGKPDCYTVIELGGARVARTRIEMDNNDPKWGERFVIACAHDVDDIVVRVKDKDAVGSKTMGLVRHLAQPAVL
jgi:C2 domain